MDRRDFGKAVATLSALWWLESSCREHERIKTEHELPQLEAPPPARTRDPETPKLSLFTERSLQTLAAALDQLLPAAHGMPSATRAHVHVFVDRELQRPAYQGFQGLVKRGLGKLDAEARKEGGKRFHELTADRQQDLLTRFQSGAAKDSGFDSARWFEVVLTLALEGYLGHPRHGGNHEEVVWNAVGLEIQCPGGHE